MRRLKKTGPKIGPDQPGDGPGTALIRATPGRRPLRPGKTPHCAGRPPRARERKKRPQPGRAEAVIHRMPPLGGALGIRVCGPSYAGSHSFQALRDSAHSPFGGRSVPGGNAVIAPISILADIPNIGIQCPPSTIDIARISAPFAGNPRLVPRLVANYRSHRGRARLRHSPRLPQSAVRCVAAGGSAACAAVVGARRRGHERQGVDLGAAIGRMANRQGRHLPAGGAALVPHSLAGSVMKLDPPL
jgi:hypothetical protein